VTSLQEYIKGINLVKESFDGSRVAGNTVQIMNDLKTENIKMRTSEESY
jgi:hypothetical protein